MKTSCAAIRVLYFGGSHQLLWCGLHHQECSGDLADLQRPLCAEPVESRHQFRHVHLFIQHALYFGTGTAAAAGVPALQFLQIAVNVLFSGLIDVSMALLGFFQRRRCRCGSSVCWRDAIPAVGITIEVAPDTLVVPGEGIVRALSRVTGKPFGTMKVYFDVTLIVIAVVLSFLFFGKLNGIGIGTVISALTVGKFVNIVERHFPLLPYIRSLKEQPEEQQAAGI